MSWDVIRITEDLKRPAGHAILSISIAGINDLPSSIEFSIHRRGHNENSLGDTGWQGSDHWFTPEEAWFTDNNTLLQFVFRSEAIYELQHMPYELLLRGKGMEEPVTVPMRWPDILGSEEKAEGERRPIGEGAFIKEPPSQPQPLPDPNMNSQDNSSTEPEVEEDEVATLPPTQTPPEPETKSFQPVKERRSDILKLLLLLGITSFFIFLLGISGYYMLIKEQEPTEEHGQTAHLPDPAPESDPEPAPEPQPAPEPAPAPVPQPAPEPDPAPVLQPAPDPQPAPPTPEPLSTLDDQTEQEPPQTDENLGDDLKTELEKELKSDSTIQSELDSLLNQK